MKKEEQKEIGTCKLLVCDGREQGTGVPNKAFRLTAHSLRVAS